MNPVGGPGRSKVAAVGEVLLWSIAAFAVFAAHAGAVALMLREPEETAADNSPPAAIMIELAAEPEAAVVEEDQITPDDADSEEIKTAAITPLPEPVMELPQEPPVIPMPVAEPEPEPMPEPITETVPEPLPEPPPPEIAEPVEPEPLPEPPEEIEPVEENVASLENVEVPLPIFRPPPPPEPKKEPEKVERKKVEKKVAKKQAPPPPASEARRQAQAQVKESNRTAARQTSAGSGSNVSPARWQSRLMSHLERRKRYPSESRANKEQGTVTVRFAIDGAGNVLSVNISRSSGHQNLDQAVLDMVRRASPVPAPPPGASRTITAPVRFNLRG